MRGRQLLQFRFDLLRALIIMTALIGITSSCKPRLLNSKLRDNSLDAQTGDGDVAFNWESPVGEVSTWDFGHNTVWSRGGLGIWDEAQGAPKPDIMQKIAGLLPSIQASAGSYTGEGSTVLRFPGGTRAMKYHFATAIGATRKPQCDAFTGTFDDTSYGLDEFLSKVAEPLHADVTLVTPWVEGSPQEAAAMVAYALGAPSSTAVLGVDANGNDWGTAGSWAQKRAANGHPEPYANVKFVEIGNEQYLSLPVPKFSNCNRFGVFRQNMQYVGDKAITTTAANYAAELVETAKLIRQIDPELKIGASAMAEYMVDSDAAKAVGAGDTRDPWNPRLLSDAAAAFDFFIIHPYDLGTNTGNMPLFKPFVPRVAKLAAGERRTIRQLKKLAPSKAVAVTEFGAFSYGDRFINGLLTAALTEVAIEEQVLMSLRHILIEDQPSGYFASAAAILGPDHALTPGYYVEKLLGSTLAGNVVKSSLNDPDLIALGTITPNRAKAAILLINLADNKTGEKTLSLALPSGAWHASLQRLSAKDPLATADAMQSETNELGEVSDQLPLGVPPLSVSVVSLTAR